MSTRGAYGIYHNGVDKITYNHYSSYPSWLGQKVIDFIKSHTKEDLVYIHEKLIPSNISELSEGNDIADWDYAKEKKFKYHNSLSFMGDSLFCEWAYVINVDTNKLEVYRGFQKRKSNNRFLSQVRKDNSGYYNVKLFAEFEMYSTDGIFSPELDNAVSVLEAKEEKRKYDEERYDSVRVNKV